MCSVDAKPCSQTPPVLRAHLDTHSDSCALSARGQRAPASGASHRQLFPQGVARPHLARHKQLSLAFRFLSAAFTGVGVGWEHIQGHEGSWGRGPMEVVQRWLGPPIDSMVHVGRWDTCISGIAPDLPEDVG